MDENQIHHAIEQAYQLIVEAHRNMTEIWRNHVLFTRQWWLGVGLSISLADLDRNSGPTSNRTVSTIRVYDNYRVVVAGSAWDCHGSLALPLGSHPVHAG
ncbi:MULTISPECIES: hypothetical protein [Paenibacillus]|uniref:hypothetical protein n=1 Tax=Paenibacillus TaxID=44249 RepID=UPI001E4BF7E7|nr:MULTISPECIES: hypothetical protein [Paenibacillus]